MDSFKLMPGETRAVFFFVNLKGRLFFKIRSKSGTNVLKAIWIKGPFGSVEAIPDLVGNGNIPFKGLIWGRLKVSALDSETIITVSEDANVAINFPDIPF